MNEHVSTRSADAKVGPKLVEQVAPPIAITTPPRNANQTASGGSFQTLIANQSGAQPTAGDTVLVHYTGWNRRTGTTFVSTHARNQPIAIELRHALPGFAEVLPQLHKGEKAILWPPASAGNPDAVVYEVEVVDILSPAPAPSPSRPRGA